MGRSSAAAARARREGPWAGAWVDLLGDLAGCDALLVEWSPGRGPDLLAERGARVAVGAERLGDGPYDLVVLDGTPSLVPEAAAALRPGGRLAVVADNRLSPLRALDRSRGRPAGPSGPGLHALRASLATRGLEVEQAFGLLRSSAVPVTAFDLAARDASVAVLDAAATRIGDRRRLGLSALRTAAARGRAAPLVPAWLVVARRPGGSAVAGPPVTGRIGYEDSEEVKVVHGDPPELVEKRYLRQLEADRETAALEALAEAGFPLAPRPVRRDGPLLATQTWLSGRALNVERLGDEELEAWILRAADVLAGLRRRTARDGEVLRHGDFWLGNLLVEGDRIVGVVDWTEATRGEPAADADHLVATLVESGRISAERGRELRALVDARLGPA